MEADRFKLIPMRKLPGLVELEARVPTNLGCEDFNGEG